MKKILTKETNGDFILHFSNLDGELYSQKMFEIELCENTSFTRIIEILSRIGLANRKEKTLCQTVHILNKSGKLFLVHFKEMFALDGRKIKIDDEDFDRRNCIAGLLSEWNLINIIDDDLYNKALESLSKKKDLFVTVIPYKERDEWELYSKYKIGGNKNND